MKYAVDLVVLAFLLYYLYKGTRRGFLLSFLGVLSIACSYVGAYALSAPVASWFETSNESNPLATRIIAGGVIFFLISATFSLTQFVIKKLMTRKREDGKKILPLSSPSRTIGGLISLGMAVILFTVLWWFYDAMRATAWARDFPDLGETTFATISQSIVKLVAGAALQGKLSPGQAELAAGLISSPGDAVVEIQALLDDPALKALFESATFHEDFLSGDRQRITENEEFAAFLDDESVMKRMRNMGLVDGDAETSEIRESLGTQLALAGGQMNAILEDPKIMKMIEELQAEGTLASGDWKKLVFDKRIREIAARALKPPEESNDKEMENADIP
jgi:hypothetical protein